MAEFKVLGSLEVVSGGRQCTPTPPKVRTVLGLLLMCANRVVLVDSFIQELWGNESLKSAVTTVQTYIYHLRKMLGVELVDGAKRKLLVSTARGYMLCVPDHQLDAQVFQSMVYEGRQHLREQRYELGAASLRRALALWRGPVLADVPMGSALEAHAIQLEEQRMRALELRIQADIELGLHRELIGELRYLVAVHPFNEWFHRQLILCLSRSGRRGEALQAYQDLRLILNEELGLDPTPELQRLQREVLSVGRGEDRLFPSLHQELLAAS